VVSQERRPALITTRPARRALWHVLPHGAKGEADAELEQELIRNALLTRTHSGKYCYGKRPLQTFLESATLAYYKKLNRMQPTSTAAEVAA
jgi:hypothetical protein